MVSSFQVFKFSGLTVCLKVFFLFFCVCYVSEVVWLGCDDVWHDCLVICCAIVRHFLFKILCL